MKASLADLFLTLALVLALAPQAVARDVQVHGYTRKDGTYIAPYTRHSPGSGSSSSGSSTYSPSHSAPSPQRHYQDRVWSHEGEAIHRHQHGRIERSESAKNHFQRYHPCPSTGATSRRCPGYVIDHIIPLKRGGPDAAVNMQWQTIVDGKAKDKWE